MQLLKKLCGIHATSGDEKLMHDFLLDYIEHEKKNWKVQPQLLYNAESHHHKIAEVALSSFW